MSRTELQQAVLLTVLYSDVFDHPLSVAEVHRFLTARCPDRRLVEEAVSELDGDLLRRVNGAVHWRGREEILDIRQRRQRLSAARWAPAKRFADWLRRVPFLRMVAVCGSQAVENGDEDGDVDLCLITEPGRLWIVQAMTMVLRRIGLLLGADFCPNYLLTTSNLTVEERNLYSAREVAQLEPLWGRETYEQFRNANRWVDDLLPQSTKERQFPHLQDGPKRFPAKLLERLLGGRLGDILDRGIHRALLRYYRWRLRRHGWGREQIERAYRRDRQSVITGGYAGAVAERFINHCSQALDGELSQAQLESWFFEAAGTKTPDQKDLSQPDPLYTGLMAVRYGGGR